ncbi:glycosyltransferase family 2 protein [Gloeopeniophorella convolvens]|nr:glycosyltransferase family 2 protein [Gloeopeniophorella convolvens]
MHSNAELFVVTGGNGFIGSHVAAKLRERGHRVRIVDIAECSSFTSAICDEQIIGNLCDPAVCERAVRGAHTVLHFAAAMGGMGTIHASNDDIIYDTNHRMTQNILSASRNAGVKRFFYASSACVYPECLQTDTSRDLALSEDDVWKHMPPTSQGLYGLEKLHSENLLHQYKSDMQVRIARFHNVYGPRGAWANGREKAPAALIRKALASKFLEDTPPTMEIWGDGTQRRSFLFIDDAVDAILLLLDSSCSDALNIGSDQSITVLDLADLAAKAAGLQESSVDLRFDASRPIGVGSRNSDNTRVKEVLGWSPRVSLEQGVHRTTGWIKEEMERMAKEAGNSFKRTVFLQSLQCSQLLNLKDESIVFAILLPITSRGTSDPSDCLKNLRVFAKSLSDTTWRDRNQVGSVLYHARIYLAIDEDDPLLSPDAEAACHVLRDEGVSDIVVQSCNFPKGHVCKLWKATARRAWEDNCDYFVLLGDDVVLLDEGWMRKAATAFTSLAKQEGVPRGFGCVAFTDTSFPGMPTFPIVHRTHLDIFGGDVIPDSFINQDGDPYIYQLYRRWGCSQMYGSRIRNNLGGSDDARYEKLHAVDWTFGLLDDSCAKVEAWLAARSPSARRKLTLDIVIPSYRVDMRFLEPILQSKSSPTCDVMFIIIVDHPNAPGLSTLQHRHGHRADVRIRVNSKNAGASASRNRGLDESAGEWVHFLDDDVSPSPCLLEEVEKAIRAHPDAAGFAGNAIFPVASTIFTTAVHLAGVTYFWDIASKIDMDIPWGVTANLIARRNVRDGVRFDLRFPKTGGGEDIDFCRRKRAQAKEGFRAAPKAEVTHPYWNNGRRSYWRFYMWAKGDGALIKMYPELTYIDGAPNSAELFLVSAVTLFAGVVRMNWGLIALGARAMVAVMLANVLHDLYRHLLRDAARTRDLRSTLAGPRWVMAVIESTFLRVFSEWGRTYGLLERGEFGLLGRRFDWFAGRWGTGPMDEERMNSRQRMVLVTAVFAILFRM